MSDVDIRRVRYASRKASKPAETGQIRRIKPHIIQHPYAADLAAANEGTIL